MVNIFRFVKEHFPKISIKNIFINLYRKTYSFVIQYYTIIKGKTKGQKFQMYKDYMSYISNGIWALISAVWAVFNFMLAYAYFTRSLSLLLEGRSGTMTVEFETAWLVLAIKVAFIVLVLGSVIITYNAIVRFIDIHKKMKGKPIAVTKFSEKNVMSLLTSIHDRLGNVENTLNEHLLEHRSGDNSVSGKQP